MILIKFAVVYLVYCGLIFFLDKLSNKFEVKRDSIWLVGLILALTNAGLYWLLKVMFALPNLITFGLFDFLFTLLANVIIFWVTDKLTDKLTIRSGMMLFMAGLALTICKSLIISKIW